MFEREKEWTRKIQQTNETGIQYAYAQITENTSCEQRHPQVWARVLTLTRPPFANWSTCSTQIIIYIFFIRESSIHLPLLWHLTNTCPFIPYFLVQFVSALSLSSTLRMCVLCTHIAFNTKEKSHCHHALHNIIPCLRFIHIYRLPLVDCIYLFMLIHIFFFCSLSALLFSFNHSRSLSLPLSFCLSLSFSLCQCIESHFAARQSRYIVEVGYIIITQCVRKHKIHISTYMKTRTPAHALVRLPSFALNLPYKQFEWFHLNH